MRSNQVAGALAAAGVGAGDRVAYLGKNSLEFFELLFGASKVGAVTVPVNWRLAAPEIAHDRRRLDRVPCSSSAPNTSP